MFMADFVFIHFVCGQINVATLSHVKLVKCWE